MKNKSIFMLFALLGLALTACLSTPKPPAPSGEPTIFEGTWINHLRLANDAYREYSVTFTGNEAVFRLETGGGKTSIRKVSFVIKKDEVFYFEEGETKSQVWQRFTLKDGVLTLRSPSWEDVPKGTFINTEQPRKVTIFEGKWVNQAALAPPYNYQEYSWTFIGGQAVFRAVTSGGAPTTNYGTFIFTDNTIMFSEEDYGTWGAIVQAYTLEGDTLRLMNSYDGPPELDKPSGVFTRQEDR
jgi:hypothetical protein